MSNFVTIALAREEILKSVYACAALYALTAPEAKRPAILGRNQHRALSHLSTSAAVSIVSDLTPHVHAMELNDPEMISIELRLAGSAADVDLLTPFLRKTVEDAVVYSLLSLAYADEPSQQWKVREQAAVRALLGVLDTVRGARLSPAM